MAFSALPILDVDAETRLAALLTNAIASLKPLGAGTILVAECPDKFNDASWDDYWFGVQVDGAYWEEAQYFRYRGVVDGPRPRSTIDRILRTGRAASARAKDSLSGPYTKVRYRERTGSNLDAARATLKTLHSSNWRAEVTRCLGNTNVRTGDVVGLGLQFGQPWLCVASSNDDTEIAFTVLENGRLVHMARCERFDQYFGQMFPLRLSGPRPDFASYLTPKAREHFFPPVRNESLSRKLCVLLRGATNRIHSVAGASGKAVILTASDSLGSDYLTRTPPNIECDGQWALASEPKDSMFEQLGRILGDLELADWRGLFGRSTTGVNWPYGSLCLLRYPGQPPLLERELTAFDFQSDRLTAAGLINWHDQGRGFDIYPAPS